MVKRSAICLVIGLALTLPSAVFATSVATGPYYIQFEGDGASHADRVRAVSAFVETWYHFPDAKIYLCSAVSDKSDERRREVMDILMSNNVPTAVITNDSKPCSEAVTGREPSEMPNASIFLSMHSS